MFTILGLGTFPIQVPIHGGQRRIDAFRKFYERNSVKYLYAGLYDTQAYVGSKVGQFDFPYKPFDDVFSHLPYVNDIDAGEYASRDDVAFEHFRNVALKCEPDAFQLEHPFMWPLVRRLRELPEFANTPVIYSSHNYEAPLKETMLINAGISRGTAAKVREHIDRLESEVLSEAALTVCVSQKDIESYIDLGLKNASVIVRNGVTSTPGSEWKKFTAQGFSDKYLLFVGSAYLPNTQGFQYFVLREGLFFLPPKKTFVVCGGVSDGVFESHDYQMNQRSYAERFHFFPQISDTHLAWVRDNAHAVILPIRDGGGSNLKTAEALVSGNWIVGTTKALRSFEEFKEEEGVIIADTPRLFAEAMAYAYNQPRLEVDARSRKKRDGLFWEACFDRSPLYKTLGEVLPKLAAESASNI